MNRATSRCANRLVVGIVRRRREHQRVSAARTQIVAAECV